VVITRPEGSQGLQAFSRAGIYIFFPVGIFAEFALILSYIDNRYNVDIFGDSVNKFFGFFGTTSLVVIVLYSALPQLYETRPINPYNISLIVLFFLLNVIETGYFLYSSPRTPRTETFGLEYQFLNLEKRLSEKKLINLNLDKAITKGINAIKKRMNEEALWGEMNPVYETACVIDLFHTLGYNRDTEWTINTQEGKKVANLGQTLDNLEAIINTAETIETTYEQFFALYALSHYNLTIIDPRAKEIDEFYDSIFEETEWDFINKLNRFTPNLRSRTTPLHIIMSYVGDVTGNIKLLDRLANLFSASVEIVVKRGYARFSTSQTGKTPIEMFARMMLALHEIRRAPTRRQQFIQAITGTQFIEGSWAGNIGTTSYVIQSLIPRFYSLEKSCIISCCNSR
ncbi:MAG: hypothetical protein ACXABK_07630, partial [Candidatus Heimdallarchaeaceae archaeon]